MSHGRHGIERVTRTCVAVAALVALLVVSACSGSDDDADSSADADTANDVETAPADDGQALVFAECMRSNGVDMPDPGPGQQGFIDAFHAVVGNYDQETIEQAMTACEDFMPEFFGAAHGGDDESVLALAECLRGEGLDVPDNLFESGALQELDEDELRAAMEDCRDVLVGGGE